MRMRQRNSLAGLLVVLLTAFGCQKNKQAFPGYTYVGTHGAETGFIDLQSVQSSADGVTFSFLSQRSSGEYAIVKMFSDCSGSFRRIGGSTYRGDGSFLSGVPLDPQPSSLSTDLDITAAAKVACGDDIIQPRIPADDFDLRLALQGYGPYDQQSQRALWKGPAVPNSLMGGWGTVSEGTVGIAFDTAYREGGLDKHVVITWTVPVGEKYDCHVCIPLLGAIVFSKQHGTWSVESEEKYLTGGAPFGQRPRCQLVRLGADRFGVVMHRGNMAQGFASEGIELVAASGKTVKSIFKLATRQDPNDQICANIRVSDDSCIRYFVKYRFVPGPNPDYFDILTTKEITSGPNAGSSSSKMYSFVGDKYVSSGSAP